MWAKVGIGVGFFVVVIAVLDWASRLEYVLGLKENPRALQAFSFLVSPQGRLVSVLMVSCAGWYMVYRGLQERFPKSEKPNIVSVSASVIKGGFTGKTFLPYGDRAMAILCLYNVGPSIVGKVRAQVEMRSGEDRTCVRSAFWLTEDKTHITFKQGSYNFVVLADWKYGEPTLVPEAISGSRFDHKVYADQDVVVKIMVGEKEISQHYVRMKVSFPSVPDLFRVTVDVRG